MTPPVLAASRTSSDFTVLLVKLGHHLVSRDTFGSAFVNLLIATTQLDVPRIRSIFIRALIKR